MEIWKDIKGYEGIYQVSNYSRIKSLARFRKTKANSIQYRQDLILKFGPQSKPGYYSIGLFRDSKEKKFSRHRLVAEAFIPNPENHPQINHKNGIKGDDRIENLEWVTAKQNTIHAHQMGLCTNNHVRKINEETALRVVELCKTNPRKKVAEILEIPRTTIEALMIGRSWSHVTGIKKKYKDYSKAI